MKYFTPVIQKNVWHLIGILFLLTKHTAAQTSCTSAQHNNWNRDARWECSSLTKDGMPADRNCETILINTNLYNAQNEILDQRKSGIKEFVVVWGGACSSSSGNSISGPLTIGKSAIVSTLPTELAFFKAKVEVKQILLQWQTTVETNNDYFVVERSTDGFTFDAVLMHNGAGNSRQPIDYEVVDTKPVSGVAFYRLKQVDFNENFSYSQMVAVSFEGAPVAYLYPDTVRNTDRMMLFSSLKFDKAEIDYIDARGVSIQKEVVQANNKNIKGHQHLTPGLYTVTIAINQHLFTNRLIVQQ